MNDGMNNINNLASEQGKQPKQKAAKKMKGFNFPVDTDETALAEFENVLDFFNSNKEADWKILSNLVHDARANRLDSPVGQRAYEKRRIKSAAEKIVEIAFSMVDGREEFENDVQLAAAREVEEITKLKEAAEEDAQGWHSNLISVCKENELLRAQAQEAEAKRNESEAKLKESEAWAELAGEYKQQVEVANGRIGELEAERDEVAEQAENYRKQLEETAAQRDKYLKELDEANKRIEELEQKVE